MSYIYIHSFSTLQALFVAFTFGHLLKARSRQRLSAVRAAHLVLAGGQKAPPGQPGPGRNDP